SSLESSGMRLLIPLAAMAGSLAFSPPASAEITRARAVKTQQPFKVETIAQGLVHPWGLGFLPDGRLIVTERPGRVRIVTSSGALSAPVRGVPKVYANGQGGLLDVALSPDFTTTRLIYLSYAEPRGGTKNGTSLARAKLVAEGDGARLDEVEVIFRQDPSYASSAHFGSRIVFTPDGSLFLTLGERYAAREQAQNPGNHLGKL